MPEKCIMIWTCFVPCYALLSPAHTRSEWCAPWYTRANGDDIMRLNYSCKVRVADSLDTWIINLLDCCCLQEMAMVVECWCQCKSTRPCALLFIEFLWLSVLGRVGECACIMKWRLLVVCREERSGAGWARKGGQGGAWFYPRVGRCSLTVRVAGWVHMTVCVGLGAT